MGEPNMMQTGIYTAAEAAALIGTTPKKIRGWISGWSGSNAAPVIENDLGWVGTKLAFSFANLMELRFIAFFEEANVNLREIRAIMNEVRFELRRPRPFATDIVFKTDGSRIVAEIAHKNGVADLYDLRSKNFELGPLVYKSLKDGVVYNPKGDAQAWFPRKYEAPNVIVHPRLAFGRPVLRGSGIPTETIARSMRAEDDIETVAELFEISKARAAEAVHFENILRKAA